MVDVRPTAGDASVVEDPARVGLQRVQVATEALFADAQKGQALMTGGADLSNIEALKDYYIAAQRRLAMAGKILFPIPNRRLSKRLYRLTADTLLVWGAQDRLRYHGIAPLKGAAHPLLGLERINLTFRKAA